MEGDEVGRIEAMQRELQRLQDARAGGTMSPEEFAREMARLMAEVLTSTSLASGAVPGMPGLAGFLGLPTGLPGAAAFGPDVASLVERLKKGGPPQDDDK
jgi:hypothetical protein